MQHVKFYPQHDLKQTTMQPKPKCCLFLPSRNRNYLYTEYFSWCYASKYYTALIKNRIPTEVCVVFCTAEKRILYTTQCTKLLILLQSLAEMETELLECVCSCCLKSEAQVINILLVLFIQCRLYKSFSKKLIIKAGWPHDSAGLSGCFLHKTV